MAEKKKQPRFEIEDIERLFRALVPDGGPDPFGKIAEQLLAGAERFEEEVKTTSEYRKDAQDSRDSIESRTFGILFLQILKSIKLLFSILPQGRLILLVIAILGIASTLIDGKPVTLDAIKAAAKSTGIGDFIESILAELKVQVNSMADELATYADVLSIMFVQIAGGAERAEETLAAAFNDLHRIGRDGALDPDIIQLQLQEARNKLSLALRDVTSSASLAINADSFITPRLRAIPLEVRGIPDLAGKLVRLN